MGDQSDIDVMSDVPSDVESVVDVGDPAGEEKTRQNYQPSSSSRMFSHRQHLKLEGERQGHASITGGQGEGCLQG